MDAKMIELLNRALVEEHMAIAQYLHHYNNVRGTWPDIIDHFKEHMDDEVNHANMLCARIYCLGGKPALEIEGWGEWTDDVDKALEQDAVAEREAINTYAEVLAHAEEIGDVATTMMVEGIIDEERHHLDEFAKFLKAQVE